jgi:hypothetical protein
VIQQIEQGRLNVGGLCTLAPNATSTTVNAANCGAGSQLQLTAKNANAAVALASTFAARWRTDRSRSRTPATRRWIGLLVLHVWGDEWAFWMKSQRRGMDSVC